MKLLVKTIFVLTFLLSTYCFADTVVCPSIDKIREAKFIIADRYLSDWFTLSDILKNDNTEWRVGVWIMNSDKKTESEMLNYMQNQIKIMPLNTPRVEQREHSTGCFYFEDEESFRVIAVSPPDPAAANKFSPFLKN